MSHVTSAIIFVLSQHIATDGTRCMDYCAERGYTVVGTVVDRWMDVLTYLRAGTAHVVVVADRRHLDPDRIPRLEVVAEQHAHPRAARTRALRRNAGP